VFAADPPSLRCGRRALTLLEVLLTLCLLVVLAAITWPALDRPIANQRLRKAAEVVRVEWAKARVKAVSSGSTYLFRYALDGDRYAIECQAGPEYVSETGSGDGLGYLDDADAVELPLATERTLPEGVTFVAGETTFDTRAELTTSEPDQLSSTEYGWSEPIFFYPDGTTSSTRLVLKNEYDRTIELVLRGLTGVVNVGEVQAAEEMTP